MEGKVIVEGGSSVWQKITRRPPQAGDGKLITLKTSRHRVNGGRGYRRRVKFPGVINQKVRRRKSARVFPFDAKQITGRFGIIAPAGSPANSNRKSAIKNYERSQRLVRRPLIEGFNDLSIGPINRADELFIRV